jgi:hypothetical protein
MAISQQTARRSALFKDTNPACGQIEANHDKFQDLPNTKGLSSSTTMLSQPRSAAMRAMCGHTVVRLLIKPSPTDIAITGGARNITLPGHIRPARLPTAGGNRPKHRDRTQLEQHKYFLKTRVSAESIVTMRCWIMSRVYSDNALLDFERSL